MSDLHNAIMNIPCVVPEGANINQAISYKVGHKDARHAAAELALATHAGAAAERVTPDMVRYAQDAVADAETIDRNLKSLRSRLTALTSTPAEPDAYNRRLRAQLEQEWADVRRLKKAYTPAETPPAAGAIDAREQAIFSPDSCSVCHGDSARCDINDCGDAHGPASRDEAPAAAGAIDARGQAQQFLDRGLADVQDEGGVNTYYSEEAVLECIAAALASRERAPAAAGAAQAVGDWESMQDDPRVNEIVSALYRRFKDWSMRGFTADDVTWCEVKAEIIKLFALAATPAPEAGKYPQMPSPRFKPTKGLLAGTELFTLKEMYAAYDLGRASLKAAQPVEREDGE